MAALAPEVVASRSALAWSQKQNWQALLAECYDFAQPDRNPYHGNGSGKPQGSGAVQGSDRSSPRVFDSTLQNAATKLCNRLQYDLFPMGQHWADLIPGPFMQDAAQKETAAQELKDLQKLLFASIQLSNFDLAISEWLQELVVAGTAVMVTTRGNDLEPVVYRCVSQAHVAFLEGAIGKIDFITIKHRLRRDQIEPQWPDATNLPDEAPSAQQKGQQSEYDLCEVCYYDYNAGLWRYEVIIEGKAGSKRRDQSRIVNREYAVSPITVSRWSKSVEEVQGRSLVMAALPDARVLSAVKNYLLKQAALSIAGVFLVRSDGVVNANTVRVYPGATIPVRSTGGSNGASVEPLQVGGNMNLAQLVIDDLQGSINTIMLNTGLPDISDGVRSATEFIERMRDMQQSIGAPFSRILREGIVPMLEAHLQILAELGLLPVPDGGVFRLNAGDVDLRFTSPLVQGQAAKEVERFVNAVSVVQQVAGPQSTELLALTVKIEDAPSWVFDKMQVDPSLKRSKQEIEQLQAQAGAAAAAQQGAPVEQADPAAEAAAMEQQMMGAM